MHFYATKSSLLCRQEWESPKASAVEITQISALYQQAMVSGRMLTGTQWEPVLHTFDVRNPC